MDENKIAATEAEVVKEENVATEATATPAPEAAATETPEETPAPAPAADETEVPAADEAGNTTDEAEKTEETTEAAPVAETSAPAQADAETEKAPEKELPKTKEEVIARLRELVQTADKAERSELDALKVIYYRIHNAEATAARETFINAGGAPEDFRPEPDTLEEEFKAQLGLVKEMRAKAAEELEKQKQANLERKLAIIEEIKNMAATPEDADKNYDAFKALQAEWKEIKLVPAEKATELWKNYQLHVEQYYDLLRLNHEFRAYDFKKNLEIKTRLCEAAEKLADVEDPVSAFHQLQKLHQEFRETGPVAKELREEVWTRFKSASTAVNKRHQAHFEELKAREEDNLVKKTALCEKVEGLDLEALKSFADWDKMTKTVLGIQAEWKTIGFTPKKMNAKIFERFRTACDKFFQKKTEFFRALRDGLAANLAAKTALCEQAEALKESTDWGATTNKFVALQKEWKAIGPVAHKVSDSIWKRFNEACNYFFDKKNEATSGQREEEEANLQKKLGIIERLEALLTEAAADAQQAVRDLQTEWNGIGHVPFRKKDKVYKKYREVLDRIYQELHVSAGRRNLENFKKNVADKAENELTRERNRLMSAYEAKKSEIQNYETNLTFFSSKSKSGNSLMEEVARKVERLKEDLGLLAEKINAVNEQIKNS